MLLPHSRTSPCPKVPIRLSWCSNVTPQKNTRDFSLQAGACPSPLGRLRTSPGHSVPSSPSFAAPPQPSSPQTSSPRPTGRDRGPPGDRAPWRLAWRGAGSPRAARPSARPAPRSGCTGPSSSSAPSGRRWPSISATRRPTTWGKVEGEMSQLRARPRPVPHHAKYVGFRHHQPGGVWGQEMYTRCIRASAACNDQRGPGELGSQLRVVFQPWVEGQE